MGKKSEDVTLDDLFKQARRNERLKQEDEDSTEEDS